jgi:hypothetical protein
MQLTYRSTLQANDIIDESELLSIIFKQIGGFFNNMDKLDACLFRSAGVGTDGIAKSTNRLHFPQIIVERAGLWNVMLMIVHNLEKMSWPDDETFDPTVKRVKEELMRLDQCNTFRNVISQNGIISKHGVRMVLCDKLTQKPYSQPVDRPLDPVRLIRQMPDKTEVFPKDDLQDQDWVTIGAMTCDTAADLTAYNPLKIVRSTRLLNTGPGGSTKEAAWPAPQRNTGSRKTIYMRANGVTAEQTQREVLTSFAIDGDVLQGPQDNVSVTFNGDSVEVNGKPVNVRVAQSLLESIGATVAD